MKQDRSNVQAPADEFFDYDDIPEDRLDLRTPLTNAFPIEQVDTTTTVQYSTSAQYSAFFFQSDLSACLNTVRAIECSIFGIYVHTN